MMEKHDFLVSCDAIGNLHFPRWQELPEFELYMDQVIALAEKYLSILTPDHKVPITPSMINNYVKSGALPPPKNKKYNRTHLALLMIICSMKSVMEISSISDIVHQSVASDSMESVLNGFAEMYENAVSSAAKKARLAVSASASDHIFSAIAIENALQASAARTVAMYAYSMIETKPEPSEEEKTKAEKKAEKAERKAEKAKKEEMKENTEETTA